MTPEDFITKWRNVELSERAASQDHFNELCELLEVRKPTDEDPTGQRFAFEKPVPNAGKSGAVGFADVWRKACFVWEYKRRGRFTTLAAALAQARDYADLLEHPPLAIACDIDEIQIRTLFTGSVSVTHTVKLGELNDVTKRQLLRRCFTDPASLKPDITPQAVTEDAARRFATLAQNLRERRDRIGQQHDARRVAHFLTKVVFCLFAEDAGLLPGNVFSAIIEEALRDKSALTEMLADLFGKMRAGGGRFGTVQVPWFNGGLFDDDDVLDLLFTEVQTLGDATLLDWKSIEPVIFGTLFERGLDPAKRKEMAGLFDVVSPNAKHGRASKEMVPSSLPLRGGANPSRRMLGQGVGIHYTDPATIMKIVEPVVLRPLSAEWEVVKAKIKAASEKSQRDEIYAAFRDRLGAFRVLDPACGSGNFLYLALRSLKDFDKSVESEAESLNVAPDPIRQRITPQSVLGIEVNPYAAELARVTVWIGELQWQLRNGYGVTRQPILGALDNIENRDALRNEDGSEAEWPDATVIVGNPPFLGGKMMRRNLRDKTVDGLFDLYRKRVPPEADLVCYWFAKALDGVVTRGVERVGLVATNSIRGGANRVILDRIELHGRIFEAWSDEPWMLDGAAVRVSLVCFDGAKEAPGIHLDGRMVATINTDLTSTAFDLTRAARLADNLGVGFMGDTKGGNFDISGDTARRWLQLPLNPNGRPNADVLKPWVNGIDLTRRPQDKWIIDFGWTMLAPEASAYEAPFEYVATNVQPERKKNNKKLEAEHWWRHLRPRPGMWSALQSGQRRYIATPTVAKHRIFCFVQASVCPDHQLIVLTRDDDTAFGVAHSRPHELWALRMGTSLEDRPRYTPSTTFETFPFPEGLTPNIPASQYANDPRAQRIARAAAKLNELRDNWLNPSDLVKCEPEVVSGFPDRVLPNSEWAAAQLAKRTLTKLYNERPAWLAHAHLDLDRAVVAAYGWPEALADRSQPENPDVGDRKAAEDDIVSRLFDLNQARPKVGND